MTTTKDINSNVKLGKEYDVYRCPSLRDLELGLFGETNGKRPLLSFQIGPNKDDILMGTVTMVKENYFPTKSWDIEIVADIPSQFPQHGHNPTNVLIRGWINTQTRKGSLQVGNVGIYKTTV